jgi:hypothetical protein
VNRTDPEFKTMLYDGLEDITKSLHDLVGGKKIPNLKVMSPMKLIDAVQDTSEWTRSKKKFWSTDPVHMTLKGYEELPRVVTAKAVGTVYDRVRGTTAEGPPRIFKRQSWVSSDDTTAHRVYPQASRGWGPPRGHRGHSGHSGHRGHRGQPGQRGQCEQGAQVGCGVS